MRLVKCKMAAQSAPDPQLERLGLESSDEISWIPAVIDLDAVIYAYSDKFEGDEEEYITVKFIGGGSIVLDATLSEFMEEWGNTTQNP